MPTQPQRIWEYVYLTGFPGSIVYPCKTRPDQDMGMAGVVSHDGWVWLIARETSGWVIGIAPTSILRRKDEHEIVFGLTARVLRATAEPMYWELSDLLSDDSLNAQTTHQWYLAPIWRRYTREAAADAEFRAMCRSLVSRYGNFVHYPASRHWHTL